MSEKTTLTLKNKETVTLRWAEPADAGAIVKLELESALYENRAEPITISEFEFTKYWEERLKGDN